ncbi:MAG: alpha/beta hydrolase [Lachnospiraceae bacterium]|nr:alpha/beta hydrolase [Lachnospiraceae bacterium]
MNSKKLAIILPGTGYHKDKPLLYYGTKLALEKGYDIQHVDYLECFNGIRYLDSEMAEASEKAYAKTEETLDKIDFSQYTEVVFIGKSFGTLMGARYASEHRVKARHVWYTPVLETYDYGIRGAIAFTGSGDPIADTAAMRVKAEENGVSLHIYEDANHSLETKDTLHNIGIMQEAIRLTKEYLR